MQSRERSRETIGSDKNNPIQKGKSLYCAGGANRRLSSSQKTGTSYDPGGCCLCLEKKEKGTEKVDQMIETESGEEIGKIVNAQ